MTKEAGGIIFPDKPPKPRELRPKDKGWQEINDPEAFARIPPNTPASGWRHPLRRLIVLSSLDPARDGNGMMWHLSVSRVGGLATQSDLSCVLKAFGAESAQRVDRRYRDQVVSHLFIEITTTRKTRVVHLKKEPFDVNIGRPGKWDNPFVMGIDGTREEVIEKYRKWIVEQPELMAALPELQGKILGCWCKPEACHGDVLRQLIEGEE